MQYAQGLISDYRREIQLSSRKLISNVCTIYGTTVRDYSRRKLYVHYYNY